MSTRQELLTSAVRCYLQGGDEESACRCYEKMGAWFDAARLHEKAGRHEEAAARYEQAERWMEAARCHRASGNPHGEARCWLNGGEKLRAAWVLVHALGRAGDARELAESVSPEPEAEQLAKAMVLARCAVAQRAPDIAAKQVGDASYAIRRVPYGSPWREVPLWALAIAEALRRPDLGALVLSAAAEGGTAFDTTWDAWSLRVFKRVERPPWEFPPEPPPRREPQAGEERINPKDGSVQVFVPGGLYTMGAEDGGEAARPVHHVRLSPFWIDKHPVTNRRYALYLRENPSVREPALWNDDRFNGPEQPVVGVSWDEAMAYATWAGLTLPTEAQWEAAARGTDGRKYPWGNEPEPNERLANFGQPWGTGRTTPVDAYPAGAGPFGTLDQAGNVDEWCLDPWNERAYQDRGANSVDPVTRGDTAGRAVRGGSWLDVPGSLAAAFRGWDRADDRGGILGFRCVGLFVPSEHA